jgi:hypothetical protein
MPNLFSFILKKNESLIADVLRFKFYLKDPNHPISVIRICDMTCPRRERSDTKSSSKKKGQLSSTPFLTNLILINHIHHIR